MSRLRSHIGSATVLLLAASVAIVTPAMAETPAVQPDYTITVDPTAKGAAIGDSMYGVFFEDINYAADGGLYAELVRNRSFEFLPVDNTTYTGLTGWTPVAGSGGSGTATTVNDDARLNEQNRTYLTLGLTNPAGGRYGVPNTGYNSGFALQAGAKYDFSVWARSDATSGTPLAVTLHDTAGAPLAKSLSLTVRGDSWTRYTGTLTATQHHRRRSARRARAGGTRHAAGSTWSRCSRSDTLRAAERERPAQGPRREDRGAEAGLPPLPRRLRDQRRHHVQLRRAQPTDRAPAPTSGRRPSARSRSARPTATSGATTSPTASATSSTSSSPRTSARAAARRAPSASTAAGRTGSTDDDDPAASPAGSRTRST